MNPLTASFIGVKLLNGDGERDVILLFGAGTSSSGGGVTA